MVRDVIEVPILDQRGLELLAEAGWRSELARQSIVDWRGMHGIARGWYILHSGLIKLIGRQLGVYKC